MTERLAAHLNALSPAQRRVLLAMTPDTACDAWGRSARVTTLYELAALGLLSTGKRGWTDARLTDAGVRLRASLLMPNDYLEAAE